MPIIIERLTNAIEMIVFIIMLKTQRITAAVHAHPFLRLIPHPVIKMTIPKKMS